jgi:hypothetical protein
VFKLWLDDVRQAPEGWVQFRRAEDMQRFVETVGWSKIEIISLDHDLGENIWSGYDFMKWAEQHFYENGQEYGEHCPHFIIHSANPVGRQNMQLAINSIYRLAVADATGQP